MEGAKAFLAKQRFEPFTIEGEKFSIRKITGAERLVIQAAYDENLDPIALGRKMKSIVIAEFLGDENGKRIYSDEDATQALDIPEEIQRAIIERGNALNPNPEVKRIEDEKKS